MTITRYLIFGGGHFGLSHVMGVTEIFQLQWHYILNQLVPSKHNIHQFWCFYHRTHNSSYYLHITAIV